MTTTLAASKKSRTIPDSLSIGPGGPWSVHAPPPIRQSYHCLDDEHGWAAWREYLARRKPAAASHPRTGKNSPLLWAAPEGVEIGHAVDLVKLLDKPRPKADRSSAAIHAAAVAWQLKAETAARDAAFGLECQAWTAALGRLALVLGERPWWSLLDRMVAIAERPLAAPGDPLSSQLLGGELPLMLAHSFGELDSCGTLAVVGRRTLEAGAAELLDGDGLPHGKYLHLLGPLLACWTRCCAVAPGLEEGCWSETAQRQYPRLVEHALRLSTSDGRRAFAAPDAPCWNPNLLATAVRLADDRELDRVSRLRDRKGTRSRAAANKHQSRPSIQSERAGIAVLRCDWQRGSPQLSVAYGGRQVVTELNSNDRRLWSGVWSLEVHLNSRLLTALCAWEQVCWESNDEVDYLELEMRLSEEVTVQRHILLARQDQFLFLADAVMGIQHSMIEYRGTLPIAGCSTFQAEAETREGSLAIGPRARVRVLPLALGEWRAARGRGNLTACEYGLELTQSTEGEGLLAALFIDLSAKRIRKPLTWRQLTVAQDRAVVPADVAVGYRVQIGKSQWIVYRSLSPSDIRTVLGKNLMHEFLVGRFGADGRVDTLLEIE